MPLTVSLSYLLRVNESAYTGNRHDPINFRLEHMQLKQPMTYIQNIPERHRQTDGRTTYCGITGLCVASRGNKTASFQFC